jgi:hypothetical protein
VVIVENWQGKGAFLELDLVERALITGINLPSVGWGGEFVHLNSPFFG